MTLAYACIEDGLGLEDELVSNPNIPSTVLHILRTCESVVIRDKIAVHPSTGVRTAGELLSDSAQSVRILTVSRKIIPSNVAARSLGRS